MARTILIADDVQINRRILRSILCGHYDILEAENGREAMSLLMKEHHRISAVLLDIVMPVMDGYAVLESIKANPVLSQIPVIVTTSNSDTETEEKALTLGATDFVAKPFAANVIMRRVENLIKLRETSAMVNTLQRDKLTGLWNRETFFEKAAWRIRRKPPDHFVLSCVDIDNFKVINDQYGTEKGDEVLKCLAKALSSSCDSCGGICGRITADNFISLIPRSAIDSGEIGPHMLEAGLLRDAAMPVTLSIGRYYLEDPRLSLSTMYDRASIAQNTIKGRYDVHVAVYDESMRSKLVREQEIINEMNAALKTGQFEAWYQPQYNHSTGALIGAEALARWRHPVWGMVSPGEFIPVFERNGFVYELDKYIWEQVLSRIRRWTDEGRNPLPVSVNISRYDLFRDDLMDVIMALTEKYGVSHNLLRLEVTESAFAQSSEQVVRVVKDLIAHGFTVEIDDFGSGYSSLNMLKDVPAQILKLDMRFMDSREDTDRGGNILESIIRMSKWIGMSVIAEGVEKTSQADYLKSVGCNYIQGYLYARPMPAAEYEKLARSVDKEERLIAMETVKNLDNNAFWNPESMDTLIFNSYVGAACIFEYRNGRIELVRATDKYTQVLGNGSLSVEDALKMDLTAHMDDAGLQAVAEAVERSMETKDEVAGEFVFLNLPGCPEKTYLRSSLRVIATAGDRRLIYCTNENITAQRSAEKEGRTLSAQFKAIMENICGGVSAMTIEEGRIHYIFSNEQYCAMFGYTPEQFARELPGGMMDIIFPEDFEATNAAVLENERTGRVSTSEYRVRCRDGGMKWVRASGSICRMEGVDRPVHVAVLYDITREKEDSARLELLTDSIPGGIAQFEIRRSGFRALYANDGVYAMIGYSIAEYRASSGGDPLSCVFEEDRHILLERAKRLFERDAALSCAFRVHTKDGGFVWISLKGSVAERRADAVIVNLVLFNVTDVKLAEEAIRMHEQEIRIAMSRMGRTIYEFDIPSKTLTMPSAGAEGGIAVIACDTPEKMLQGAALDEAYRDAFGAFFASILRGEKSGKVEYRQLVQNGSPRWRQMAFSTVFGSSGKPVKAVISLEDTTQRHIEGKRDAQDRDLLYTALTSLIPLAVSINLTQNSYHMLSYNPYTADPSPARGSVDELVQNGERSLPKADRARFARAFGRESLIRAFSQGQSRVELEHRQYDTNGKVLWMLTQALRVENPYDSDMLAVAISRDITEQKRAEELLQKTYDLTIENMPNFVAKWMFRDGDVLLLAANQKYLDFMGIAAREAFGNSIVFWLSGEEKSQIIDLLYEKERARESISLTQRFHKMDGRECWLSIKASFFEAQDGHSVYYGTLTEVTELVRAQEELRISQEEYRIAASLSNRTVLRCDVRTRKFTVLSLSDGEKRFAVLEGESPEALVKYFTLLPESVGVYKELIRSIETGVPNGKVQLASLDANGDAHWVELAYTIIFDMNARPATAIISVEIITERKLAEDMFDIRGNLLGTNEDVRKMLVLNLRTNEIEYESNGPHGEIVRNAGTRDTDSARAFSLLNYVYAEDAAMCANFFDQRRFLTEFRKGHFEDSIEYRGVDQNGRIRWMRVKSRTVRDEKTGDVKTYLVFTDIDEKKREEIYIREKAELDPLTGVLNRGAFAAQIGQMALETGVGARFALLMMDIDGFKQLNDTFGHAAGDQALIDMAVALRSVLRPSDLVGRLGGDEFMVALQGVQNEQDIANKARMIRDMLRKSYSAQVRTSVSIGIAVCPRDGEDFEQVYHRADAALYCVKDSGKDNYAFFRPGMEKRDSGEKSLSRPNAVEAKRPEPIKRRMLIVEDNRISAELLAEIFRDEFLIDAAENGADALTRLRHFGTAVSVVLLDLMLPGMDGYEVLKKIRSNEQFRCVPVIVVSGSDDQETLIKALRCGATDFVSKPVDGEIIRLRVQSAISKAENERLRAQNSFLSMQSDEIVRYRAALEGARTVMIENDWRKGTFVYDPAISRRVAGNFDQRALWRILTSDMVADAEDVRAMQETVLGIANDPARVEGGLTRPLRTPSGEIHSFRIGVVKLTDEHDLADKIIIALTDLDERASG